MKKFEYKYEFEPEMYNYVLATNILNRKKDEHKIFKSMEDFARMLKEEASSQEEVEMIRQTAQRIAQM